MISKKLFFSLCMLAVFGLMINITSCDDDTTDDPGNTDPLTLVAKKLTTGPTIDGAVDGLWGDVKKITVTAEVPDPGNDVFKGYVGDEYTVNLRAAYDDNFIYFLCEWDDPDLSQSRQTWYFDPADDLWKQESRVPIFDGNVMIRKPFYEDKFSFLWNVNNSTAGWDANTCWTSCHTGLGEANGYARHFTNSATATIDMWHWKLVRTNVNNQADDQYQDNVQPNGRHGDSKVSGGYSNNVQTLNNGVADVSVPKYFIPGMSNYYWITQAQIDGGTAKLITAVDAAGVLTYDGGTIDPTADTDFQRDGDDAGAKGMPSIYTEAFVGNRGDLTAYGVYTGSGWSLEIKRALDSGDAEAQDVDFSALEELKFGIGVFDNSGIAHAIRPNLTLIFE